ncbi:MAG: hypothetical protein KatS3mg062_1246 [Tepidiforma sp.]|nr:MAG: hypothetical protein KatS3mg062_1246 [Tepidiforma sp.]
MVNPVLTILVDLVLVGGALSILAVMVTEAVVDRRPRVGGRRNPAVRQASRRRAGRPVYLTVGARRVA